MQVTDDTNTKPLVLPSTARTTGDEAPTKKDFFTVLAVVLALVLLDWVAYHVFNLHG